MFWDKYEMFWDKCEMFWDKYGMFWDKYEMFWDKCEMFWDKYEISWKTNATIMLGWRAFGSAKINQPRWPTRKLLSQWRNNKKSVTVNKWFFLFFFWNSVFQRSGVYHISVPQKESWLLPQIALKRATPHQHEITYRLSIDKSYIISCDKLYLCRIKVIKW